MLRITSALFSFNSIFFFNNRNAAFTCKTGPAIINYSFFIINI